MRSFYLGVVCAWLLGNCSTFIASAQRLELRSAPYTEIPTLVDGNSPTFWQHGLFHFLTSTGSNPVILEGTDQFSLSAPEPLQVDSKTHFPLWMESVWSDDDGTIYGWYHHEQVRVCPGSDLTAPQIGAAVSYDGGVSFQDLGLVLTSGEPLDCGAGNGIFAGGNGDFSVILDREGKYFYFLFTHYGGDLSQQGVAVARMSFEDRKTPWGSVRKYFAGGWTEPGLGGRVSPIFPAGASWRDSATDSFWGPAVHWNTHLNSYVILMNRSCCSPRWPQEGIYASFNYELANPDGWRTPYRVLTAEDIGYRPGYYPQVIGLGPGETDTLAGEKARLFIHGKSKWEVVFLYAPAEDILEPVPDPPPDDSKTPSLRRPISRGR